MSEYIASFETNASVRARVLRVISGAMAVVGVITVAAVGFLQVL
jgi:hypothetical protein